VLSTPFVKIIDMELSTSDSSLRTGRSSRSDLSTAKSSRFGKGDASSRSSDFGDKVAAGDGYEKLSSLHESLVDALASSAELQPLHVDVRNDSYWYNMRARMGPKKHAALIVKHNDHIQRWESFIFKMKLREEDMEMAPKKSLVGNHKTKWAAYKAAEAAARERDANPAKNKKLADILHPDKILSTHFRILVVSEKFHQMSLIERHSLVYQELTRAMGFNIVPDTDPLCIHNESQPSKPVDWKAGLGRCAPTKLKFATVFGPAVCALDVFRFLLPQDHTPLHLMVDTRTPSQWRPDLYKPALSERLGTGHHDLRALQIKVAAKPKSHQSRVKKLTTVVTHEMLHQLELEKHHVSGGGKPPSHASAHRPSQLLRIGGALEDDVSLGTANTHSTSSSAHLPDNVHGNNSNTNNSINNNTNKALLADSLGLDASVSGVKYKKLGGIYGHFFNDLSPEIRQLVMSKYQDNKHLIRDESNLAIMETLAQQKKAAQNHDDSNQPKTTLSMMRNKQAAAQVAGEYDKGTDTEHAMMEEVNIANLRQERAAIRLQRIRRMYVWHRAVKRTWWRNYSVLHIQRLIRGHFARQYVKLYKSLRPRAAVRIQRCFRCSQSRVFLRIWQYMVYKLTRIVLPKIKRFIRNCFLSWLARRAVFAVRIQKIVRGFVGRARYYKKVGQLYYQDIFPPAALKIQKIIRGFLGRRKAHLHVEVVLRRYIDIPAAVRLQRIYRGRLAKLVLEKLKVRAAAVLTIQHCVRAYVHRVWARAVYVELCRKRAATLIQKRYRGTLDRQLYKMKYHVHWYNNIYIPSIILVQSAARRFKCVRMLKFLLARNAAVRVIHRAYQDFCARKLAKAVVINLRNMREYKCACSIQRYVRRRLAIVNFKRKKLEYKGKITLAAKIIVRAWSNYVLSKRYKHLLDEHRRKMYNFRIRKYIENREDVYEDMKEIRIDISLAKRAIERYKERIRKIELFEQQASIRCGKVKLEMSQLRVEDFERGWAEALGQEYETLQYQVQMSREELRLLRHHIKRRQREILYLQIELEEVEMDMDNMETLEIETEEALRRAEIAQNDRDSSYKFQKEVRREKSHWKITSNRKNVILRNRPRYQAIVSKTTAGRDLKYASTVSYEKRARERDMETLTLEKMLAEDARKQDEENRPKTYLEYAGPVQSTYDQIVTNSLSLLRGMSLDERASKLRDQFKAKEVKKKKAQKGQFAPLKEMNESGRKFDKYK